MAGRTWRKQEDKRKVGRSSSGERLMKKERMESVKKEGKKAHRDK